MRLESSSRRLSRTPSQGSSPPGSTSSTRTPRTALADLPGSRRRPAARHFYDIHRLLGETSPATAHLAASGDLTEIVRGSERVSALWFGSTAAPMHGSFADAVVFADSSIAARLSTVLAEVSDMLAFPDTPRPTWDDVVEAVTTHRGLLTVDWPTWRNLLLTLKRHAQYMRGNMPKQGYLVTSIPSASPHSEPGLRLS